MVLPAGIPNLTNCRAGGQERIHIYLVWVQSHGLGKDGRVDDFAAYLEAIDFTVDAGASFPKSTERREKR